MTTRRGRLIILWVWLCFLPIGLVGCVPQRNRQVEFSIDQTRLARRAMEYVKAAMGYEPNPAVRVQAVETLRESGREDVWPWIRSALLDDHPAVRFAACVAIGELRDATAEAALHDRLTDDDPSVRVAALFAMHRLGYHRQSGKIATLLLYHDDPGVRRNAALVLGLLGEPGAVKILARAMKDRDEGVRDQALEAMARLGNAEARKELAFMTNTGIGSEEVFAINALVEAGDPAYVDTFRYKLETATHRETQLAAAYGLALHQIDDGFDLALRSVRSAKAGVYDPNDPPAGQVLRVQLLAARVLGAVGRADALPDLAALMEKNKDPRLQVAVARAILQIVQSDQDRTLRGGLREGSKETR